MAKNLPARNQKPFTEGTKIVAGPILRPQQNQNKSNHQTHTTISQYNSFIDT